MHPLSTTIDGHTLTVPAEPAALLALGAGLALAVVAVVLTRAALAGPKTESLQPTSPLPKQAMVLRILWGVSALAAALLAYPTVQVGELLWALPPLKNALLAAGVLGWLSFSLAGVEGWLRLSERDSAAEEEQPLRWRAWVDLPVLALLGLALLASSFQLRQRWQGVQLPAIQAKGCAKVHQGLVCRPVLQLTVLGKEDTVTTTGLIFRRTSVQRHWFSGEQLTSTGRSFDEVQGWRIPEQPVPSARLGESSYSLYAVRGDMMVRTTVGPYEVVEDRADPRVQIPVGATWRFTSQVTRTQRVILLKHDTSSWEGPKRVAQVGEPRQQGGLRVYPLTLQEEGAPARVLGHLVNVDGETRILRGETAGEWIVVEAQDEDQGSAFPDLPEGAFECRLPFTPGVCLCAPAGTVEGQELAGPVQCLTYQSAGAGETLLMGFLALATLGLTPGVSQGRTDWVLESARVEPQLVFADPEPAIESSAGPPALEAP